MKSVAATLMAAMLLQEPEKVDLFWSPPPGRIVVVSLSTTLNWIIDLEIEAEAELHSEAAEPERRTPTGDSEPPPPKGKRDGGGSYLLKGTRYFVKHSSARNKGSFHYERGKEPVIQGDSYLQAQNILRMKDDIKISITDRGRRHIDRGFSEPFDKVSTGVVQLQVPPIPVKEGISWTTGAEFSGAVPFKGKLKYTVRSIQRGKLAKIDVLAVPDDFFDDDAKAWTGNGVLTFSFEDGLISSSTFTLTKRDKKGKVLVHFHQVLTQKLKP